MTRVVWTRMSPRTSCPVAGSSGICPEMNRRLPARMAGEYGPIAGGAVGEVIASLAAIYAALTTFCDRMHRVQTRSRFTPPLTIARTVWRLGSKRRGRTLCA